MKSITLVQLFNELNLPLPNEAKSVADLPFYQLQADSRQVADGDVFILLKPQGADVDFTRVRAFLEQVADKAVFVLSEISLLPLQEFLLSYTTPIFGVPDIRSYLGDLIGKSLQLQNPTKLPKVLAVTGTNGKTTISQLSAQLFGLSGSKTAVMGTAGNGILPNLTPSTHTTLEVYHLHHAMFDFAKSDVQNLCIEASSHGLHQNRLQGVPVKVAIFSNLSRDHLDYHADMDEYGAAKARLFDKGYFKELTHAIINSDDEFGKKLAKDISGQNLTIWTYSTLDKTADFFADNITPSLDGVVFELHSPFGKLRLKSPLLGLFNVANLLAAIAGFLALSADNFDKLTDIIPKLQGAKGRMQVVGTNRAGAVFIVDYAHTPDALTQVLQSLKAHCQSELWAVFGCGGDRDKGKRPLMTQAALAVADKVILTADNPRSEEPNAILKDMQAGMSCDEHYRTVIESDRKTAIEYAVQNAKAGDIVVIAGKGHETYQEIKGVRYDFDDVAVVQGFLDE